MSIRFFFGIIFLLLVLTSSCDSVKAWYAREFRQAEVADGVARLTTQSLSMIVNELIKNKQIGFDGPHAKVVIIRSGDEKTWGKGKVTVIIEDQEISYPERETVYVNCVGDEASIRGRVRVKRATREISGLLTNNKDTPVIPDPDSTVITVELEFDNLKVKFTNVDEHLKFISGHVSFVFHPLLAQSQSGVYKGLKIVGTPNATFENVKLKNVVAMLHSPEVRMEVPITSSNLTIHVGKGISGKENHIDGEILIFDTSHDVPTNGQGLDPKYNVLDFNKGYDCAPEINGKVSFQAKTAEELLGSAAAALNAMVTGTLIEALEKDQRCGFSSYSAMKKATISGMDGEEGAVTFELAGECDLHFRAFTTEPDVFGNAFFIEGTAIIEQGKMQLEGLVATTPEGFLADVDSYNELLKQTEDPLAILNDKPRPILPLKRQMATLSLEGQLSELLVKPVCLDKGITSHKDHCKNAADKGKWGIIVHSGRIQSQLSPLMAKDLGDGFSAGFCAAPTKNAHGSVEVRKLKMSMVNDKSSIGLYADGRFDFYSGRFEEHENALTGLLSVNDEEVAFVEEGRPFVPLDPTYQKDKFKNSYLLGKKIVEVDDDKECGAEEPLAPNVARLLVANAGHLLRLGTDTRIAHNFVDKNTVKRRELSNRESTLRLFSKAKDIDNFEDKFWKDADGSFYDVKGSLKTFEGTLETNGVRIHAPKNIAGVNLNLRGNRLLEMAEAWYYDQSYIYVKPTKPDSTNISMRVKPRRFRVVKTDANVNRTVPYLTIENGMINVDATPIRGRDKRERGQKTYSIGTPIVKFNEIGVSDSFMKLKSRGLSIPLFIKTARIKAQNGFFKGEGNFIEGEIEMVIGSHHRMLKNGNMSVKKITINKQFLLNDYDQEKFDKSYRETPNLMETISPY